MKQAKFSYQSIAPSYWICNV